jgi:hypothetical protein
MVSFLGLGSSAPPLDNQLRTTSLLNAVSNLRRFLVGEFLMMDSMVLDPHASSSEKSKQPHSVDRAGEADFRIGELSWAASSVHGAPAISRP